MVFFQLILLNNTLYILSSILKYSIFIGRIVLFIEQYFYLNGCQTVPELTGADEGFCGHLTVNERE